MIFVIALGALATPASADITSPSAPAPSTTSANAPGVTYDVAFNATNSLVFPNTITLTGPAGTFTNASFSARNVTTGNSFISTTPTIAPGGASVTLRVNNNVPTIGGDRIGITITNATNTAAGTHTWTIATSQDPTPVTTPSYTLTASQTLTSLSAPAPSTTSANAPGVTYDVAFTTSSTGQLLFPGTITLTAPAGTFTNASFSARNITTGNSFISTTPTVAPGGGSVTLRVNNSTPTAASDRIGITITDATNAGAGSHTWTIATSSDPTPQTTPSYTLTAPQTLTNLSAPAPSTTSANAPGVTYDVAFTTSSTGQLLFPGTITLTAPAGTFTNASFSARNITTNNSFVSTTPTIAPGGGSVTLRVNNSTPTAANDRIGITVTNATNAGAGSHTWTIATSSDPTPQTTPSYTTTAPQTITNLSAPSPSTVAANAAGVTYNVGFNASSTGQLVFPQTITLTAPAGTFTGASFSGTHGPLNTFLSTTPTIAPGGGSVTLRVNNSTPTAAGSRITITVTDATNAAAGSYTWTIATTSDPTPQTTPSYTIGVDTSPPDTAINSGPSGPTTDSTPTFTFTSTEGGSSFMCRVDTAAFAPCTSPHTTPALAPGPHTFEVQATDPSNNTDASPAARSFMVTAPPPADTTPPDTTIVSGPTGTTADTTPTFEFNSSEPGSTFQCKIDNSPFLPCSSPFTTPPLAPGSHTFQVRAIDASGNIDPSPAGTFGISAAQRAFTVETALPKPVVAKRVNVEPVKGAVFVSVPAGSARASGAQGQAKAAATVPGLKGRRFIPLSEAKQIPVGSILDTRKGTVRLTSAQNSSGATQSSTFASGVFQVLQSGKGRDKGLTEARLKGASFKACRTRKSSRRSSTHAQASARSKRRIRRLRGNGKGRFRTRGRYSAATVRGTDWTVTDRCDGTLTQVKRGKVAVRDFRRRKNVSVRAGKRYLARAPG